MFLAMILLFWNIHVYVGNSNGTLYIPNKLCHIFTQSQRLGAQETSACVMDPDGGTDIYINGSARSSPHLLVPFQNLLYYPVSVTVPGLETATWMENPIYFRRANEQGITFLMNYILIMVIISRKTLQPFFHLYLQKVSTGAF